jgi:hypothetical protein
MDIENELSGSRVCRYPPPMSDLALRAGPSPARGEGLGQLFVRFLPCSSSRRRPGPTTRIKLAPSVSFSAVACLFYVAGEVTVGDYRHVVVGPGLRRDDERLRIGDGSGVGANCGWSKPERCTATELCP